MKDWYALRIREEQLRKEAEQVCAELRTRGADWQDAWRCHPVAVAYRDLLKEAWGNRPSHHFGRDEL